MYGLTYRTLVVLKTNGALGVVIPPSDTPHREAAVRVVFFEEEDLVGKSAEIGNLEAFGLEVAVANPSRCCGERPCGFFKDGVCGRFGDQHWPLMWDEMRTKGYNARVPVKRFPECQWET